MSYAAEPFSGYFRRSLFAINEDDASVQQLNDMIRRPVDNEAIDELVRSQIEILPVEVALRRSRRLLMMALACRDISGQADLDEICRAMTTFAEQVTLKAIESACEPLIRQFGTPRTTAGEAIDLLAVGMGKAGAHELNVSSDLDLVFLFRESGETDGIGPDGKPADRSAISAEEFFHKLARRVITILADTTPDGFVFRIDTRLRPNGDSGPLVCSFGSLEDYLQSQGREWERFAWLKARVIAQSQFGSDADVDIQALQSLTEPFVFRRYLDYTIFDALRQLHDLIQQEARKRDARRSDGFDVKLGRGGIREIEFCAQLFQIVRGGKDRELRDRSTLSTLSTLASKGVMESDEAKSLASAYQLLRKTEHMLQYREDQQTHFLSGDGDNRAEIAAMLGLEEKSFLSSLDLARKAVKQVFDALLAPEESETVSPQPTTGQNGAPAPQDLEEHERLIEIMREGHKYASAQPDAQRDMDSLLASALAIPVSRTCLIRLIALLETVCRRPGYLALLAQYPMAFERVLNILATSNWAAEYLTRHPVLMDELIDSDVLGKPDFEEWQTSLTHELLATTHAGEPDIERQMDIAREQHHAQMFRVLARDLDGRLSVEQVSDQLTALADCLLKVAIQIVWDALPWKFREQPQVTVIAYGRLGGKELGYASDLDLVFLFDDADERAQLAYAKLAQRMSTWLSAQTAAGTLFEIDLRLRPNGDAGMLVSSFDGFREYQLEAAWLWEYQALTRARFCAGDEALGERFESLRRELLAQQRDPATIAEKIRDMRKKMHDGHPNRTELFDLKHDTGGMVDIEFAVQYLVLVNACDHPALLDNLGNIALLGIAGSTGLIKPAIAEATQNAYRSYRRLQHQLRLGGSKYARVPPEQVANERAAVEALWAACLKK